MTPKFFLWWRSEFFSSVPFFLSSTLLLCSSPSLLPLLLLSDHRFSVLQSFIFRVLKSFTLKQFHHIDLSILLSLSYVKALPASHHKCSVPFVCTSYCLSHPYILILAEDGLHFPCMPATAQWSSPRVTELAISYSVYVDVSFVHLLIK
jgi:hypothetical protein